MVSYPVVCLLPTTTCDDSANCWWSIWEPAGHLSLRASRSVNPSRQSVCADRMDSRSVTMGSRTRRSALACCAFLVAACLVAADEDASNVSTSFNLRHDASLDSYVLPVFMLTELFSLVGFQPVPLPLLLESLRSDILQLPDAHRVPRGVVSLTGLPADSNVPWYSPATRDDDDSAARDGELLVSFAPSLTRAMPNRIAI